MFARVGLATVLVSGLFAVAAPSASATCDPEKPSTCEPVGPHCHVQPHVDIHTPDVDPGLYCHGFEPGPIDIGP